MSAEAMCRTPGLSVTDLLALGPYTERPRPACTARPWRSCSRPDGQALRHWDRVHVWVNRGDSCEASS